MVTLPGRRRRMIRAIEAWTRQTHSDRELIVVIDQGAQADRDAAAAAVAQFGGQDIKVVLPPRALTLGALRNLAVAQASGAGVCVWDDDDLHHPLRVARQLAAMVQADAKATVLQDVMLFREAAGILHWTNWAATPAGGLPGTLLCRTAEMPAYAEDGPQAHRGEDLDLLLRLRADHDVLQQAAEPHLYVYVTHGENSSSADHHALLADRLAISKGLLKRREETLRDGLRPFGLDGASVEGPNGCAFSL
ncbi:MAG: glycosyltransferase family 2 protein [Alphaproteobacteria bacterium]|nr:glycosyltransferase family 2 protein [Alphaproteobacteria bacterium]MBU1516794.1 glycosyltransferase family 2 protein [Alphaproteobacteria bacterium]MBU2092488.1 glycosyltransferase family 2 protein [Alphaproteobacteria bacterium]MBU2152381.1 glycosyltransferase family 2 protein [Alphaproteobacteria bacterium]MBU2305592.1 glycosyltransferase family 2 protein [Alphaproteobacteria bacterium]